MIAVISGPPGSGKSTLAHVLADQVGIPAVIRDEIKQGMAVATGPRHTGYEDLNIPAMHAFFDTLTVLARAGVSIVAEAAFQDKLWRPNLIPLTELAQVRIIHCTAPQHVLTTASSTEPSTIPTAVHTTTPTSSPRSPPEPAPPTLSCLCKWTSRR
ncbi:AAA family ATPase [Nocardia sp. NPDC087230]|uniref:AAA family ATPase n=1 Tax=Nocardia sp. NPDC087230 TaxID=3364331 RepID=UPI0038075364